MTQEADAVRERYARRSNETDARRYSMLSPVTFQAVHERQRQVLSLFRRLGFEDVSGLRLVEVGAGAGGSMLEFLRIGFAPENLMGIELLPERVAVARQVLPAGLRFVLGDASEQRIAAGSVDIVYQSGVFSSLLDDDFQIALARTMWQWVRPGGGVLWYDFAFDNPANPDVRGVSVRRVRQLFPEGRVWWRRVTLAPPLARRVAPIHPALYTFFNAIPYLRTHRLCWIGKP
jgi:SAM-dependent methyltransferase